MMSHLDIDKIDPNLWAELNYRSKRNWIILAAIFGVIGLILYLFGISEKSGASGEFVGNLKFSLDNAGPGLIVMLFALACSLVGASRSKIEFTREKATFSARAETDKPSSSIFQEASTRSAYLPVEAFNRSNWNGRSNRIFAVFNSEKKLVLQSVGWEKAVPEDIKTKAQNFVLEKEPNHWRAVETSSRTEICKWEVMGGIFHYENQLSYLVVLNPMVEGELEASRTSDHDVFLMLD